MVKESLEEGYCDVSGKVGDLSHVGMLEDSSSVYCLIANMATRLDVRH